MLRPVAVIAAAIGLCQPSMSASSRASYAKTVREAAGRHGFDPLTAVAVVWHESGWRPGAVHASGRCMGLGQIDHRFIGACARDVDPVKAPSRACQAVKSSLLDGHYNIRVMAKQFSRWRKLCRTKTGRPALLHRWLQGYGGFNKPGRNEWCGQRKARGKWRDVKQPTAVKRIIQCRRRLLQGKPCRRRPR